MKIVCSEGGPLIGLDKRFVDRWSGAFGKRFIGDNSPFASDYDAVCHLVDGRNNPVRSVTSFSTPLTDALVFGIPLETTVVSQTSSLILLAQVEAAEESWSFSDVKIADFDQAFFNENTAFELKTECSEFMIFDAAYKSESIGEDYLSVEFARGLYRVSNAVFRQSDMAELNLFRIELMTKM